MQSAGKSCENQVVLVNKNTTVKSLSDEDARENNVADFIFLSSFISFY